MDIKPIEYDADMDRFYIPVNSRYEIQTKGKGSSFRIANTVTHERNLVGCKYVQAMLEDMAKATHAELMQQQAEITSLREQLEIAKKDGWISVKDRLPENVHIKNLTVGHSKAVLGYVTDNLCTFCVSYDYERKAWRYFDDCHNIVWHEITHWQPLPEPPKEQP